MLRHSDMVMYDRETESWWQQLTGEAIVGELTGKKLRQLPAGDYTLSVYVSESSQWLTSSQLLDRVALSVATPGPFMLTALCRRSRRPPDLRNSSGCVSS
jgi:hypothetical protein